MRIALVYDAVYPWIKGGAERRIAEVASRLADKGHDVHIFGIKWWDGPSVIERDGATLHGICQASSLYTPSGRRSIREALVFGSKTFAPIFKNNFDIIDVSIFPYFSCFSARAASLLRNSPMVITWHEVWGSYWKEYLGSCGQIGSVVELSASKLCQNHISVSKSTGRGLLKMGVSRSNIYLIPNGVDLSYINGVKPSRECPEILFVGRLIKEKNVDILIKAMGLVRKEFPDIRCGIIGDGPERDRLEILARQKAAGNVEFFGFIPDSKKISMMKSAEVLAFPSTREGFGMVVLEAMACGLPVITTNHPMNAAADLISNNGFKGDLSEDFIADKIEKLLANPEIRRDMSSSSIRYAHKYDWDNITRTLEKTYREIAR